MPWITPSETELAATLSQREIDAFRQSAAYGPGEEPVAAALRQAAWQVRGACRSNGRVRLDRANPDSVPRSCLRALCAIVAYDILKRLPVPVGEDRRRAYEEALGYLEKIATRAITPENGDDESDSGSATVLPVSAEPHNPPRLLD